MSSGPEGLEQIEQPQEPAEPAVGGLADRAERPSLTTEAARESQQAAPAAGAPERQQNDRLMDRWESSPLKPGRGPGDALDRSRGDVAFPFNNRNPQAGRMERWSGGLSDGQRAVLSDVEARVHVTAGASRAGSESYNQRLSEARADAVATWLKSHGVRAQITAEGTGETRARDANKPDGVDDPDDRVARIVIIPAAHAAEPGLGGHGDEGSSGIGHQESDAGQAVGTLESRSGLPDQEPASGGGTSEGRRRAGVSEQSPALGERGPTSASRAASAGHDLLEHGAVGALSGSWEGQSGGRDDAGEPRSGVYPDDPRWGGRPIPLEDWKQPPGVRESEGANRLRSRQYEAGTTARADRLPQTIRSSVGEAAAYHQALLDGEIGLERPEKVHTSGRGDFITARRLSDGRMEIVVSDVKTRSSAFSSFPKADKSIKARWHAQIRDAISEERLRLNDPALERQIQDAYAEGRGRVRLRQIRVDLSPQGQGTISGLDGPVAGHRPQGATWGTSGDTPPTPAGQEQTRRQPLESPEAVGGPADHRERANLPGGELERPLGAEIQQVTEKRTGTPGDPGEPGTSQPVPNEAIPNPEIPPIAEGRPVEPSRFFPEGWKPIEGTAEAAHDTGVQIAAGLLHEMALGFERDWKGYVPVGPAAQGRLEQIGRKIMLGQDDASLPLGSRIDILALRLKLHDIAEQIPPGGRLPVNLQIHNKDGLFVEDAEAIYLKQQDGTWRVSLPGPGPEYNPQNASVHIPWVRGEGPAPDLNDLLDPRIPDSYFGDILMRWPGVTKA